MRNSAAAFVLALAAILVMLLAAGCRSCAPNPLQGDIQSYSGSKGQEQEQQTPLPQPTPQPKTQTIERHEIVTDANSVFSIGAPAVGYIEERQVTAQLPVNFWFEYLNPDMSLTLNGIPVEITSQRGAGKTAFTSGVTGFSYVLKYNSKEQLSYNLRIVPSAPGTSVPIVTRETWTAP
jgi:hypothetical protein